MEKHITSDNSDTESLSQMIQIRNETSPYDENARRIHGVLKSLEGQLFTPKDEKYFESRHESPTNNSTISVSSLKKYLASKRKRDLSEKIEKLAEDRLRIDDGILATQTISDHLDTSVKGYSSDKITTRIRQINPKLVLSVILFLVSIICFVLLLLWI
jgi:hypothetical protein